MQNWTPGRPDVQRSVWATGQPNAWTIGQPVKHLSHQPSSYRPATLRCLASDEPERSQGTNKREVWGQLYLGRERLKKF